MEFKFSNCVAFETSEWSKAVAFYHDVIGLKVVKQDENEVEMSAGPMRLFFFGHSEQPQVVFEFLVSDLEAARDLLLKHGCKVVCWEGKGGCCYIRDPFGFLFNLHEE